MIDPDVKNEPLQLSLGLPIDPAALARALEPREPDLDRTRYREAAQRLVDEVLAVSEADAVEIAFTYLMAADGQGREHEARCWAASFGKRSGS